MSVKILFNIPEAADGLPEVIALNWYQSDDGETWDLIPVDSVEVPILPETVYLNLTTSSTLTLIDEIIRQFEWNSLTANPSRYHLIKTIAEGGSESETGLILPPETVNTAINVTKIDDGQEIYNLNQEIELMLQLDTEVATSFGDTLVVRILDKFDNLIDQVTANKVGDNLYVADYKVPNNLKDLYNINEVIEDETVDTSIFYLKDLWIFPDTTSISFDLLVNRVSSETAIKKNSVYTISIGKINNVYLNTAVTFTSEITPLYASVDDVIGVYPSIFEDLNPIDIALQIAYNSKIIDALYMPTRIYNQEALALAIRCFARLKTASDMLLEQGSLKAESKVLDTMEISKTYTDGAIRARIEEGIEKCSNIILAGGLDNPYVTKRFVKGIFDPNRPQVSRGRYDNTTNETYLNYTENPVLLETLDGNIVEVRGYRTVKLIG